MLAQDAGQNLIGGSTAGAGNDIEANTGSGVLISGSDQNMFTGNTVQGNHGTAAVSVTSSNHNAFYGNKITGNSGDGINLLGGDGTLIGSDDVSQTNIISQNTGDGIDLSQSSNCMIVGNYIGTDAQANFVAGKGNTSDGVYISGASSTNDYVSDNTIRDDENGVTISAANGNFVQGNIITNNAGDGVFLASGASNDTIGGKSLQLANSISSNSMNGVEIAGGNDNPLLENSIFSNIGLGIDLDPAGVTPNDPQQNLDGDTGSDNLQNFPVLTTATVGGSNQINGYIQSAANTTYVIEFFGIDTPNASGYGEGETYLGNWTLTTNSGGVATFRRRFPVQSPPVHTSRQSRSTPMATHRNFPGRSPSKPTPMGMASATTRKPALLVETAMAMGFPIASNPMSLHFPAPSPANTSRLHHPPERRSPMSARFPTRRPVTRRTSHLASASLVST